MTPWVGRLVAASEDAEQDQETADAGQDSIE
jgi:hypothetical protein